MSYSNEWLRFRKSEDEYFYCRHAFMQNNETVVNDISTALALADDNETALRFLLEMTPKTSVIILLLPKVVEIAIDSTNLNAIKLSRDILLHYKNEPFVRSNINTCLGSYIAGNDDWHYRRIAELYKLLNYNEELVAFITLCQESDNIEIREVGDDFRYVQD